MSTNTKMTKVREKLLNTALELFLDKGYDNTTVNEIIKKSKTSKGSFYHHFRGKEELLFCVAYKFDEVYNNWLKTENSTISALQRLKDFNVFVCNNLENSPYKVFYSDLYGMQVRTQFERHILNPDRLYYKLVDRLFKEAIENGEITTNRSYSELEKTYTTIQRGLTYDWCLNKWNYSITNKSQQIINAYLDSLK